MGKELFFSWYMIFIVTCVTVSKSELVVSRASVSINPGRHDCISNCSHKASKGNSTLLCSVDECTVLEESENNSQKSEVEAEYISFEKYTDEKGKEKLALYFKWSPVDNISLERTKGYLINVSDGNSSYSTCYNVKTPMKFHTNSHDLFYNDCFGKVKGTNVMLGTKIVVRITPLPLWIGDSTDGMVTFTVEVPHCGRKELFAFSECQSDGVTIQPCVTDCSSYSKVDGVTHPVHCTLSKSSLHNLAGKELCDVVNKPLVGSSSAPKHVQQEREWYKYRDLEDGNVKIALNFSWTPRGDSSIEYLHGYYLEITPTGVFDLTNYNKCFAIHTNLTELEHSEAKFFHDCYGRGKNKVEPGKEFHIHLNSIPPSSQKENFSIKIPECMNGKYEREEMKDVTFCINQKKKLLFGTVDEIFCQNRSMKYTYHVSPEYGRLADIIVCERGFGKLGACKSGDPLVRMFNVPRNNTLYNISLPSFADLSLNYTIIVHGSKDRSSVSIASPDFSKCVKKTESESSTVIVILILVVGILCVFGLVFLVCFMCKKDCWRKFFVKYVASRPPTDIPVGTFESNSQRIPQEPAVISEKLRVYVVFMDDQSMHKDVVHWFCAYLRQDLGLHVKLNIWDTGEVSANPVGYMTLNVKNADKVVVICSEGTRHCLRKTEYDGNMFTPVVQSICNQSFIGNNPGKFLVGYFDYSEQRDVPELLREHCLMYFSLFNLMKQFEQFYFRLVGVEQFQQGGIQRIEKIAFDRYYDPSLTSCGKSLKEAIDKMKRFVQDNPTWYNDEHGADQPQTSLPPQPIIRPLDGSMVQHGSILDPNPGLASISHLHAAAPPELCQRGVNAGPKLQNTASQPQHAEQRRLQSDPRPAPKPGKYQPLSSMTSASTESSFIVQDTETEDLSMSPSGADGSGQEHYRFPPRSRRLNSSLSSTFAAESFHDQDYATMDDNNINSRLLENKKPVTRIGLTPSMERLREASALIDMSPFLPVNSEEEAAENQAEISPESGVFTLANIDDDEEEDDGDIEHQFKSINLADFEKQLTHDGI